MKVFYEIEVDGEPVLKHYSTTSALAPYAVRTPGRPGLGKQFWAFPDIGGRNPDIIETWSFQNAPSVVSSVATNAASIAAISVTPDDVFTWPAEAPAE